MKKPQAKRRTPCDDAGSRLDEQPASQPARTTVQAHRAEEDDLGPEHGLGFAFGNC